MWVDGANEWTMLWRLAFPPTRPALATVAVYTGVTVWNGFLLPPILTQSPSGRTMPLAAWSFQGQSQVNVPAVLASVVLSTAPILVLCTIGRRSWSADSARASASDPVYRTPPGPRYQGGPALLSRVHLGSV